MLLLDLHRLLGDFEWNYLELGNVKLEELELGHLNLGDLSLGDLDLRGLSLLDLTWGDLNLGDIKLRDLTWAPPELGDINFGDLNFGDLKLGDLSWGYLKLRDLKLRDLYCGNLKLGDLNLGDLNLRNLNFGDLNLGGIKLGDHEVGSLFLGDDYTLRHCNSFGRKHYKLGDRKYIKIDSLGDRKYIDLDLGDHYVGSHSSIDLKLGDLKLGGLKLKDLKLGDLKLGPLNLRHLKLGQLDKWLKFNLGDLTTWENRELVDLELGYSELGDYNLGDITWAPLGLRDLKLGDPELGDIKLGHPKLGNYNLGDINLGDIKLRSCKLGDLEAEFFRWIDHLNGGDLKWGNRPLKSLKYLEHLELFKFVPCVELIDRDQPFPRLQWKKRASERRKILLSAIYYSNPSQERNRQGLAHWFEHWLNDSSSPRTLQKLLNEARSCPHGRYLRIRLPRCRLQNTYFQNFSFRNIDLCNIELINPQCHNANFEEACLNPFRPTKVVEIRTKPQDSGYKDCMPYHAGVENAHQGRQNPILKVVCTVPDISLFQLLRDQGVHHLDLAHMPPVEIYYDSILDFDLQAHLFWALLDANFDLSGGVIPCLFKHDSSPKLFSSETIYRNYYQELHQEKDPHQLTYESFEGYESSEKEVIYPLFLPGTPLPHLKQNIRSVCAKLLEFDFQKYKKQLYQVDFSGTDIKQTTPYTRGWEIFDRVITLLSLYTHFVNWLLYLPLRLLLRDDRFKNEAKRLSPQQQWASLRQNTKLSDLLRKRKAKYDLTYKLMSRENIQLLWEQLNRFTVHLAVLLTTLMTIISGFHLMTLGMIAYLYSHFLFAFFTQYENTFIYQKTDANIPGRTHNWHDEMVRERITKAQWRCFWRKLVWVFMVLSLPLLISPWLATALAGVGCPSALITLLSVPLYAKIIALMFCAINAMTLLIRSFCVTYKHLVWGPSDRFHYAPVTRNRSVCFARVTLGPLWWLYSAQLHIDVYTGNSYCFTPICFEAEGWDRAQSWPLLTLKQHHFRLLHLQKRRKPLRSRSFWTPTQTNRTTHPSSYTPLSEERQSLIPQHS